MEIASRASTDTVAAVSAAALGATAEEASATTSEPPVAPAVAAASHMTEAKATRNSPWKRKEGRSHILITCENSAVQLWSPYNTID